MGKRVFVTLDHGNFRTAWKTRWTKTAEVSEITFYFLANATNANPNNHGQIRLEVGSLTETFIMDPSVTEFQDNSLVMDVSSLANGVMYDIAVKIKASGGGYNTYIRWGKAIGS